MPFGMRHEQWRKPLKNRTAGALPGHGFITVNRELAGNRPPAEIFAPILLFAEADSGGLSLAKLERRLGHLLQDVNDRTCAFLAFVSGLISQRFHEPSKRPAFPFVIGRPRRPPC